MAGTKTFYFNTYLIIIEASRSIRVNTSIRVTYLVKTNTVKPSNFGS